MEFIDYALVWKEEQPILSRLAGCVPDNGTIVEIGTALGGTARLFDSATAGRGIRIYTVDVAPFRQAFENLSRSGVEIVVKSSDEFALIWREESRPPIDLLYIDGSHHFSDVCRDFLQWGKFLRPGGVVAFHDYDPPDRGGIIHFAVRVFLDTLWRMSVLDNPHHEYKLFYGNMPSSSDVILSPQDCLTTLVAIGREIGNIRDTLFTLPHKEILEAIRLRTNGIDSLTACYCLDRLVRENFEFVAETALRHDEFRRWTETLSIHDHVHGGVNFVDDCAQFAGLPDFNTFSRLLAREQMRITTLVMMLKSVVTWEP